jgi:hypothetical protein
MAIDKDRDRKQREAARREFEVAYFTKELGRPLQRKMLERQLATLSASPPIKAAHHDEVSSAGRETPPEDRAG